MRISPLVDRFTVVLVGNFNPAIFTPAWFALNKLVSTSDAENAKDVFIHSQLSQFTIGDLSFHGDKEKFQIGCQAPLHGLVRDILISTFGTILVHTPITAVGMNREVHFDAQNLAVRDEVGSVLAPRAPWGAWAQSLENTVPRTGDGSGLVNITMSEARPSLKFPGSVQATVQPSRLPKLLNRGIYMAVNSHYDLASTTDGDAIKQLIAVGEEEWAGVFEKADFIIDQIQALTQQCEAHLRKSEK